MISGLARADVKARPGEDLLTALIRHGAPIAYLCQAGDCATCRCRLLQGEVELKRDLGHLLTPEELARGDILACQAMALSDVEIAIPGVSPEAFPAAR